MELFPDFPEPEPSARVAETPEPHVFSVSEITQTVRSLLEENLRRVWVEGEVSNYRKQASGHQYFTLKDEGSQLSCVMFARPGAWRRASPPLEDGMCVRAHGNLTVYEARGQYQLNVQMVQPAGAGLLQAKFEALKRKLEAEGLFDPERKRALPAFPARLAIVTSPSGAALRDMLNVLARRSPWVQILISPVRVQGEGAAREMAAAVAELNSYAALRLPRPDVIIVARGGGSAEDLWEFNEEVLARAIAASEIPVISAVGHETDFSISDFVADLRASTPSAVAELATPDRTELLRALADRALRLQRCTQAGLRDARQELASAMRSAGWREPRVRLDEGHQRADFAAEALRRAVRDRLAELRERLGRIASYLRQHRPDQLVQLKRQELAVVVPRLERALAQARQSAQTRLDRLSLTLRLLSPEATLKRGYAMVFDDQNALVRSVGQVGQGSALRLHFSDGDAAAIARGPGEALKPKKVRARKPKNGGKSSAGEKV